jgi:hypothetical protein
MDSRLRGNDKGVRGNDSKKKGRARVGVSALLVDV